MPRRVHVGNYGSCSRRIFVITNEHSEEQTFNTLLYSIIFCYERDARRHGTKLDFVGVVLWNSGGGGGGE